MPVETKSYILVMVALISGFMLGTLYQQRTDEHKLIMAEWKKIQGINTLVDMKLQNEVVNYKEPVKKSKIDVSGGKVK